MSDEGTVVTFWWQAATLRERWGQLSRGAGLIDRDRGQEELALWCEAAPFDREGWLARRLAACGLDREAAISALGAAAPPVSSADQWPSWFQEYRAARRPGRPAVDALPLPESLRTMTEVGFLDLIEPLVSSTLHELSGALRPVSTGREVPFEPEQLAAQAFGSISWGLLDQIVRTLVLELNVARLEGRLVGSSPQERFAQFCTQLREPERADELFAEYPVMARRIVERLQRWREATLELAERLAADWDTIRATFPAAADAGRLTQLDGGAGDTHRGGRTVAVLTFQSGFRLVYKPRPLAIEQRFQNLLNWLTERGVHDLPRAIRVIERRTHGWMEFVTAAPCADRTALERFYRRQGGLLALLHALDATDLHYENLIAAGEHPIPIDLESLFHPRRPHDERTSADTALVTAAVERSVLRVGLLPQRALVAEGYGGIDLSGLGAVAGQVTPELLQWADQGTDQMHAAPRRMVMPDGTHLPRLEGATVSILDFEAQILAGFAAVYRVLQEQRDRLVASDGPIGACAGVETRFVLRPTHIYGRLLHESLHPDYARQMSDLERFFDRLWLDAAESAAIERATPYEIDDLLAGDVPLFTVRTDSTALQTSRGVRLEQFFASSGLANVVERLAQFSERDLARQIWFVQLTLATVRLAQDEMRWPSYTPGPLPTISDPAVQRARYHEAAAQIAQQLGELALESDAATGWLGLAYADKEWSLVSLLDDLYAGAHGIVLFLGYFGAVGRDEPATRLAQRALASTLARSGAVGLTSIGAYNGLGSAVYALSHLGQLWRDESLLTQAEAYASRIADALSRDRDLDVVGGAAGAVVALLSLHAVRPQAGALELAIRCGDFLLERAQPAGGGLGWMSRIETDEPITGFSHGAAGIGWALLRLADASGQPRFREGAWGAFRYEFSQFSTETNDWANTAASAAEGGVSSTEALGLSVAWCYGAPGIGLSRVEGVGVPGEPEFLRTELRAAIDQTLRRGFGRNHSLCHGDLGNLEFLGRAAARLGDPALSEHVARIGAAVLESIERHGPLCGVPLGVASPALMNGLAGIGYGLLQLAHPRHVPSVLALEPPPG